MIKKTKCNRAFTLVELLVVISLISLFSVLMMVNYRAGDAQLKLQRSSYKLAQDIGRAEEMAISAKSFQGTIPGGYGIYFNLNSPGQYILFADLNGNKQYDANEMVETLNFENTVSLQALTPIAADNSLAVIFSPPDPTISFFPDAVSVSVTIKTAGLTSQKIIQVNKVGLISVQ